MTIILRQSLSLRSVSKFSFSSYKPTPFRKQQLQDLLSSSTNSRRSSSNNCVLVSPVKKYFSTHQKHVYDEDEEVELDLHRTDTDTSSSSPLIHSKKKKKKNVIPISTSQESPLFKNLLELTEQDEQTSLQQQSQKTTTPEEQTNNTTHNHKVKVNDDTLNNRHRISLLMELNDKVGILHDILRYFWKYNVNISRIESRPCTNVGKFDFFVDIEIHECDSKEASKGIGCDDSDVVNGDGDDKSAMNETMDLLLHDLEQFQGLEKLLILDEKEVQWFPRHVSELDLIANRTLDAGIDLESNHPGFHDPTYRKRREELASISKQHKWNQSIPTIQYTSKETSTWTSVWDSMMPLIEQYACKEYQDALDLMKVQCGYSRNEIPQQSSISTFLKSHCNFVMRPVPGLLSSRDFLNGLAFRTFFCTQYIRHHSKPLYTPEPDICHELLGHAPMFANADFCDFSQEIGLASLGASDEDIEKLASCYWFSVEFGLCKEGNDEIKAYGAGLLSSIGEIEYACKNRKRDAESDGFSDEQPQILPWDPNVASMTKFPITTYQPVYFIADSLPSAKKAMRRYCEDLPRPFFAQYNSQTETVHIDRPVRRTKGKP